LRTFLTALLTAGLLIGLVAAPVTAKIKPCADFQTMNAEGTLSRAAFVGEDGTVNGQFFLAADSCKNVTYTLVVVDDEGDSAILASSSVQGGGGDPFVNIQISGVTASDEDVCAFVTSNQKKKALDVAPSDGCVVLPDDGSTPAGGKGF
jgi:hypothetical protein